MDGLVGDLLKSKPAEPYAFLEKRLEKVKGSFPHVAAVGVVWLVALHCGSAAVRHKSLVSSCSVPCARLCDLVLPLLCPCLHVLQSASLLTLWCLYDTENPSGTWRTSLRVGWTWSSVKRARRRLMPEVKP